MHRCVSVHLAGWARLGGTEAAGVETFLGQELTRGEGLCFAAGTAVCAELLRWCFQAAG